MPPEKGNAAPDIQFEDPNDTGSPFQTNTEETEQRGAEKLKKAQSLLLNVDIDSVGLKNMLDRSPGQKFAETHEVRGFYPDAIFFIAWAAKDASYDTGRDITMRNITYAEFKKYNVVRNFWSDEEQRRLFDTSKIYFEFVDSGGKIEPLKDKFRDEKALFDFLATVGTFAKGHYDFKRAGNGTPGIVDYSTITSALKADVDFQDNLRVLDKAIGDYKYDPKNLKYIKQLQKSLKKMADFLGVNVEELLDNKPIDFWVGNVDFGARLEDMLAKKFPSGVCRDIGVYQARLAHDAGVSDTFSSTANWKGAAHLINGGRTQKGTFYFLNYGDYYETKSANLKDALAEYEQNVMKGVSLIYYVSRGEDDGQNLVPVQTKAGEQLSRLARGSGEDLSQTTERTLEQGTVHLNDSLDVNLDRYETSLRLTKETLAGSTIIQVTNADNRSDIYNSINQAIAVHAGHQFEFGDNKQYGLKLGTTYVNGELKTNSPVRIQDVLFQINPSLADKKDVSPNLQLRYALGLEAIMALTLGREDGTTSVTSGGVGVSAGTQLAYMGGNGEIFIGLQSDNTVVQNDIRSDDLTSSTLYPDNLGVQVGGKYKARKVELGAKVQAGIMGLGEGENVSANLQATLNNQYFLNLNAEEVLPRTFLVTREQNVGASVGANLGKYTVVNIGYYHNQESDHAPEQGVTAGLRLIF